MKNLILKLTSISLLLLVIVLFSASDAKAVACTEPSPSGDYTVASSCSFGRAGIDGVDNGNITINTGVTLTITSGQTVVWNSGKSITIATGASIQNGGGSLLQANLYAVDQDADQYGKSTTDNSEDYPQFYTTQVANSVRVNTLIGRSNTDGDCQDTNVASHVCYTYSYSQGSYYRYAYGQGSYYRYGYGQGSYYRYGYGQGYYCFLEDTKILLADGSYKAIKDIKVGDQVVSYNTKTGERVVDTVKDLIVHSNIPSTYLTINGELKVTPNHPLYINGKWNHAGSIKVDDKLVGEDGEVVVVNTVELSEIGVNDLYNIHLDGQDHNYFADGILAHNK